MADCCFISVQEDITGRKKIEESLKKSEQMYRSIIENAADGIMLADEAGTIIEWNRSLEIITGLKREEMIGKNICDTPLIPEHVGKKKPTALQKQKGELPWLGRIHEGIFIQPDGSRRVQRKDKHWIWQHDRAVATYEKDGVMYADGISSDVTKRKLAEQKLLFYQKRLRSLTSQY